MGKYIVNITRVISDTLEEQMNVEVGCLPAVWLVRAFNFIKGNKTTVW